MYIVPVVGAIAGAGYGIKEWWGRRCDRIENEAQGRMSTFQSRITYELYETYFEKLDDKK